MPPGLRLLVVTAVAAEAEAVARGLHALRDSGEHSGPGHTTRRLGGPDAPLTVDLLVAGVGPGAAGARASAALTTAALRDTPHHLVVTTGISGGFSGVAAVGSVVVADAIVAADLGARTADGFLPVEKLGFGTSAHLPPAALHREVAAALGAVVGPVLTASTVTGTARTAEELATRYPGAAAEAMEGFGVAEAAAAHGVPVLEIRAVSNTIGPRDRDAWRIGDALEALSEAFTRLTAVLEGASFDGTALDGIALDGAQRRLESPEVTKSPQPEETP
jgi:futalosine hydrolase